ncbi:GH23276 [Drosophila grimshawi]|uniref:GH23276 n=1 Tax=Drosophila grimshawi TaxID=7222 RepID=B4K2R8_DROGR|nr:GH23276 [Drosophila grimshawi]
MGVCLVVGRCAHRDECWRRQIHALCVEGELDVDVDHSEVEVVSQRRRYPSDLDDVYT